MKKLIIALFSVLLISCQTAKINSNTYKTSPSTTELGAVGTASKLFNLKNSFVTHSFPLLESKVRLDVQLHPFNKKIYNLYKSKIEGSATKNLLTYNDSLPDKPQYATFDIMDKSALLAEYNSTYNEELIRYLEKSEKSSVISSVAVYLENNALEKLKTADTYYLINSQDHKYTIALFKDGKKTDTIDLHNAITFAYTVSNFCWATDQRGKWYPAGLNTNGNGCEGKLVKKIKKKQQTSLYDM